MKKLIAAAMLSSALVGGFAFAADPILGTWTADLAKSKITSGPAPQSLIRTYTEAAGIYTLESKSTAVDGKQTSQSVQYRNGKNMKVSGETGVDTIAAKKINDNTWDFELKSGDKVVGRVHRVVSADGKTLSVHNTGALPDGSKGDDHLVFAKQP
jgi:hypothetical protein